MALTVGLDFPEVVAGYHFICIPGRKDISRLSRGRQWRNHGGKRATSPLNSFTYPKQPGSKFARDLTAVTSSPQYRSVRSLAELFARVTWSFVTAKNQRLWPVLNETVLVFEEMARTLQDAWSNNPWVDVQVEEEIPEPARETLTQAWGVLKTILFTTVMVQQSVITATAYLPPPSPRTTSSLRPEPTPASIARILLEALSNLSFVVTKFGGVTLTARISVFPQLRRLFYSALDVLSTDPVASKKFIIALCRTGQQNVAPSESSRGMRNAKMAFSLACIEQLIPNVDEEGVQSQIFDMCVPYVVPLLGCLVLVS